MAVPASRQELLAVLDRYIRIPTLSRRVTAQHVADVRSLWQALGVDLQELMTEGGEGTPALYAEIPGSRPGPTVLLYGHYDVQPVGNLDGWRWAGHACDPWVPSYFLQPPDARGDLPVDPRTLGDADLGRTLLVGRGGVDNKGQHLANILGVLHARQAGTLRGAVKILLDGEEEHGSPNLAAIVLRHRDLLAADLLLGSDGPKTANNAPTVVLGCRGLLGVEVRVDNGRGQSVHSGNFGNVVASPVFPLARILALIAARVDTVAQRHGAFKERALARFGDAVARSVWEPFLEPTTNVNGLLTEGMALGQRRTIIPGWALATIDVRLTLDTPPEEVYAALEAVCAEEQAHSPDLAISVRQTSLVPPSYTEPDRPDFEALLAATHAYWEREPVVLPLLGGTLPNYIFTDLLGLPAYWLPGAQANNRQHDVNEHLLLEHFFRQPGWYAAALDAIGEQYAGR